MSRASSGGAGKRKKPKRAGGKGPKRPETARGQAPPKRPRGAREDGQPERRSPGAEEGGKSAERRAPGAEKGGKPARRAPRAEEGGKAGRRASRAERQGRDAAVEPPLKESVVCVLSARGRHPSAEPFFAPGPRVSLEDTRDARPGDLVLVRLPRPGRREGPRLMRRIGRPDVAADVLEGLMLDRGLARRFPPGVERAAADARDRLAGDHDAADHDAGDHDAGDHDAADQGVTRHGAVHDGGQDPGSGAAAGAPRRDLRGLTTFTIDPATARDFDDAISAEELPGGRRRVWVHIADVCAYVTPGSALDREAYLRGTSVYVPGRVEPMLPEALSNDACSLKPGVDRLAVTVELEFDGPDVVSVSFYRSRIRSDERLDYDRVDRILAGEEPWSEPWGTPLRVAREVASGLQRRRDARGALAITSSELAFAFDEQGHLTGSTVEVQTESHRLIEHLMIAANEQVATLLSRQKVGTLYRVHERPDPARVERLADQLSTLEVPIPPVPERMSAQQAAELIGEISQAVAAYSEKTGRGARAFGFLVLRTLKQALYTPEDLGHAGLRSERYCHFTSPIRRYPDLVCHRALLSAVGGGEEAPRPGGLAEQGTQLSARERDAMRIERDAEDIARAFLLERRLFEDGFRQEFDGEVIGLIGAGAFVLFGEGQQGMLPVRRLGDDWWELNEEGTMLVGERSGSTLRLGDAVRVRVGRIDVARGRVDLEPVVPD